MTIELRRGDFVDVSRLSMDQYDKVAKAFEDAGVYEWYVSPVFVKKCGCDCKKREVLASDILGTETTIPAIGTKWIECEDGDVVEVVAHHRDAIVCWSEDEGYLPYDVSDLKKIGDRERFVIEIVDECGLTPYQAERVHDAGYRKQ